MLRSRGLFSNPHLLLVGLCLTLFPNRTDPANLAALIDLTAAPRPSSFVGIRSALIINEILASPAAGAPEFVELFNRGQQPVFLEDLTLEDARRVPGSPVDSALRFLEPGGYITLTGDLALFHDAFGSSPAIEIKPWPALNNGGDLVLIALASTTQDSIAYASDWIIPGLSMERIFPDAPSYLKSNWSPTTSETGGTPGSQNSVFVDDRESPTVLSVEYLDENTIELRFSEPVDPTAFTSETLTLDGEPLTLLEWMDGFVGLSTSAPANGLQLGVKKLNDYSGNSGGPYAHQVAQRAHAGDLVITEIMFDPGKDAADHAYPEFVEISNMTHVPISLAGIELAIGPSIPPEHLIVIRREGRVLMPGSAVIVYSEPDTERMERPESGSSLDEAHAGLDSYTSLIRRPFRSASLGMNNNTDTLLLLEHDGSRLDSVTYRATWHDDRYRETAGRSLYRHSEPTLNGAMAWSSTPDLESATPGWSEALVSVMNPAPPGGLVLSEIMYDPITLEADGRPDQTEFLEMTNISSRVVDLNGLHLLSGPADRPLSDSMRLVFRPTPLAPGQTAVSFVLPDFVPDSDIDGASFLSHAFPTDSHPLDGVLIPRRTSLGLSNEGEEIELRDAAGAFLDGVSYNPTWHHFLVHEASGTSLERIDLRGNTNDSENWTTSIDPAGATPGAPNSVGIAERFQDTGASETRALVVEPGTFSPDADGVDDIVRFTIRAPQDPSAARILIYDLDGRLIKRFAERLLGGGSSTWYWAGDRTEGARVPPGIYIVLVQLVDPGAGREHTYKAPVAVTY